MKNKVLGISLLTVTCLYGILAAIILLIFNLINADMLIGIYVSIGVIIIQFLISPWLTDLSMKLFYKANFNVELPEYLKSFLFEECKKYNMKNPKVAIIEDGGPNAFTYGRTKNDARIVITRGILNLLSEDEVKAVVAHEMGHVVHHDMLFMTAVQVVPLVLYAIYETFSRMDSNSKNDNASKAAIIGWIAYLLYLISQYVILWLSRVREYYADAFSVEETKSPNSLANALVKIGFGLSVSNTKGKHNVNSKNALGIFDSKSSKSLVVSCMNENNQIDKTKIQNAMKWEMWNPWALWFQLNSTHPLISKRLLKISERCKEFNEEAYIVFDLKKEESYVDDFFIELLINFLPTLILIVGVILIVLFNNFSMIYGIVLLLFTISLYIKFNRSHKNKNYKETTVSDLLGEVKVSHITSVPCELKGTIIGRGNPGCIFNEDYIIKDQTGIIFLDYNQPLNILNKIFAVFESEQNMNKEIKVKGWYRRSPVPYVEIKEYEIDGKIKKIWTYKLNKGILIAMGVISVLLMILV